MSAAVIPVKRTSSRRRGRLKAAGRKPAPVPLRPTLSKLRDAVKECRACPLWERATQAVFGEGVPTARVMFVGEKPGFDEDLAGKPFVGSSGKLLDKALEQAGISRREVYVTNVVKHFKWEAIGQQHIHKKPNAEEIAACRPWLEAELALVQPEILVCLGATAAQALLGRDFRVSRQRGQWVQSTLARRVIATVHPSSILRAPNSEQRHAEMAHFVEDLRRVADAMSSP